MDWLHANRLKTLLIIGLLVVNLIMVFLMWWKMPREAAPSSTDDPKRISGSATLMQQVLALSDTQTRTIDDLLRARREGAKPAADSLGALKLRLAEELFSEPPDTLRAGLLATEIGRAQAIVELNRYRSFREILAVLSPEQRTAFKPVVVELFGRKPPREEPLATPTRPANRREGQAGREDATKRPGDSFPRRGGNPAMNEPPPGRGAAPPPAANESGGPPTVEEKLSRYVQRLRLSDDQARAVEQILLTSREKGRALREQRDPDRAAVEVAKEQIRKEEDEQIMRLLTEDQKHAFTAMRARKPR